MARNLTAKLKKPAVFLVGLRNDSASLGLKLQAQAIYPLFRKTRKQQYPAVGRLKRKKTSKPRLSSVLVYAGLAEKHQQVLAEKHQQVLAEKSTLGLLMKVRWAD
jgi:hypothetical protein